MAREHISAWMVCLAAASCLILLTVDRASAQEQPSAAQIIEALKPKSGSDVTTRSLTAKPQTTPDRKFIDSLRNRQTRMISIEERTKAAEIAKVKPSIDLEITFDYDSDAIGPKPFQRSSISARHSVLGT